MDIHVNVQGQKMTLADNIKRFDYGSDDFVRFIFDLSSDWDGLLTFAQFRQGEETSEELLGRNNAVTLPGWLKPGLCSFVLFGITARTARKGTTNCIVLSVTENGYIDKIQNDELTNKQYKQLMDRIIGIETRYATRTALREKVDKIEGKGLSANDYTDEEKAKLAGIDQGANRYGLPTASAQTKGGVKIGSGLTMDGDTLKSTYDPDEIAAFNEAADQLREALDDFTPETAVNLGWPATTTKIGGIMLDGVDFTLDANNKLKLNNVVGSFLLRAMKYAAPTFTAASAESPSTDPGGVAHTKPWCDLDDFKDDDRVFVVNTSSYDYNNLPINSSGYLFAFSARSSSGNTAHTAMQVFLPNPASSDSIYIRMRDYDPVATADAWGAWKAFYGNKDDTVTRNGIYPAPHAADDTHLTSWGDLNEADQSGFYVISETVTRSYDHMPAKGPAIMLHMKGGGTTATQVYFLLRSGDMFVRSKINSTWKPWCAHFVSTDATFVSPERFRTDDEDTDCELLQRAVDYAIQHRCDVALFRTYVLGETDYIRINKYLIKTPKDRWVMRIVGMGGYDITAENAEKTTPGIRKLSRTIAYNSDNEELYNQDRFIFTNGYVRPGGYNEARKYEMSGDIIFENLSFTSEEGSGVCVFDCDRLLRFTVKNCFFLDVDKVAENTVKPPIFFNYRLKDDGDAALPADWLTRNGVGDLYSTDDESYSNRERYAQSITFRDCTVVHGKGWAFWFTGLYDVVFDRVLIESRDNGILVAGDVSHSVKYYYKARRLTVRDCCIQYLHGGAVTIDTENRTVVGGTAIEIHQPLSVEIADTYFECNVRNIVFVEDHRFSDAFYHAVVRGCWLSGYFWEVPYGLATEDPILVTDSTILVKVQQTNAVNNVKSVYLIESCGSNFGGIFDASEAGTARIIDNYNVHNKNAEGLKQMLPTIYSVSDQTHEILVNNIPVNDEGYYYIENKYMQVNGETTTGANISDEKTRSTEAWQTPREVYGKDEGNASVTGALYDFGTHRTAVFRVGLTGSGNATKKLKFAYDFAANKYGFTPSVNDVVTAVVVPSAVSPASAASIEAVMVTPLAVDGNGYIGAKVWNTGNVSLSGMDLIITVQHFMG